MADAYLYGLRLLARRELSEAQLRIRLTRRAHPPDQIDDALTRLRADGALDDGRTAAAIARTAINLRRLGPRRIQRAVEAAGISVDVAAHAVREALDGVDAAAAVDAALERGLSAHRGPIDDRLAARLYRRLVAHGHDPEVVSRALSARRRAARDQ